MGANLDIRRRVALAGASLASAVGVCVAGAAALERGVTVADRALAAVVAAVLVLAAHVLPALSRSTAARALWLACLALASWGHASFFVAASSRAGDARAATVGASAREQALRAELEGIAARPLALVGVDLARCRAADPGRCGAGAAAVERVRAVLWGFEQEEQQARRAAELRGQLGDEAGRRDAASAAAQSDPVAAALATATGTGAGAWSAGFSLASSPALELLAALLWPIGLELPQQAAQGKPQRASATQARAQARSAAGGPAEALARVSGAMSALSRAAAGVGLPWPRASPSQVRETASA